MRRADTPLRGVPCAHREGRQCHASNIALARAKGLLTTPYVFSEDDAEGLTRLIGEIETRRKTRNDIEQDAMVRIRARNPKAEKETLTIERESETARLDPTMETMR